ncbi:unnamed protein product, partial [Litomosoides sigmodontis]
CTPVFYAIQGGCFNSVKLLVEKGGADICIVSDKGQSLLHVACLAGQAHIVRWIVNRSTADVILWTTKDNANAIHCASYIIRYTILYDAKANLEIRNEVKLLKFDQICFRK